MARFYGKIGFAETVTIRPGVVEDSITERSYFGSVERDHAKWKGSDVIHQDLDISNVISIVADAYAEHHIYAMRYVEWAGVKWRIASVDVLRPRLTLRLGGLYNGPIPNNHD